MNTATQTIQDEWLLSLAAGTLDQGRSVMVASQVGYHDDLKEKLADAESIGGAMLESAQLEDVDSAVLDRILDQIDDSALAAIDVPNPAAGSVLPAPVASMVGGDVDALKWRFMGPGMSQVRLWNGPNEERLWLLRAKGGIKVPEHGHTAEEWTLLLKGGYQTDFGHFGVGAMDMADQDIEHQPVIDADEECICLVLTQGPIRLNSFMARAIQPFIGL